MPANGANSKELKRKGEEGTDGADKRQKSGDGGARASGVKVATATCASNIAVIKYWGKRDNKLLLPINSSLSVTLDPLQMGTTTTAAISPDWNDKEVRLWLNGKEEDASAERIQNCLKEIKARAGPDAPKGGLRIVSTNNFPTAAGLASSASGYACLVSALGYLYDIEGDLSVVARQGSGSACRSVYGGFVKWEMGSKDDGSDSRAVQVAKEDHWPSLQALILVVSDEKKKVSSTGGMKNSVNTSKLLKHRADVVVAERVTAMEKAIQDRDFETFGKITMQESNQFHACCLDTWPPIFYLNDTSKHIINTIHEYNDKQGKIVAAYTFDAGPNAVVYTEEPHVVELARMLVSVCPPPAGTPVAEFITNPDLAQKVVQADKKAPLEVDASMAGKVKYVIHSMVGCGPSPLAEDSSLVDLATGEPKA